jgi:cytochrome c-type biogenesis protein CcmH/NrfG
MAIISLRAYNHEIEGMIDNRQLDEAVAHCRHILTTFPKHIATYRLLGKAHLEQQRISDATDIFQRVLSSVPDDFIANVGMSIIREDENNLDSAIWHMELAYEAQPANVAIQDELRRLYGRRDGMQPPKVRLTRGALARMYTKGGLYDQAVTELRAAVAEEPNRPDLQLLLAEMFFQAGQRVEAVETCANILKKIPLCLEANRILAVCLPEAEGSEKIRNYRQIVISMDPYYAYAAPESISSDQVPDNAVNIERLEYQSGIQVAETPAQPNWATSLGISIDSQADENVPEWLKSAEAPVPGQPVENVAPSVSPFIWDSQDEENIVTEPPRAAAEIPEWMKDAGWQPTSDEAPKPPEEAKPTVPVPQAPQSKELEKADLPEWLSGIAPEGILGESKPAQEPAESTLSTPWLEQHQPGPSDSIIHWLEDNKPEKPKSRPAKEEESAQLSEDEVPDWLKDLEPAQSSSTPVAEPAPPTPAFTVEASSFIEQLPPAEAPLPAESPFEGTGEQPELAAKAAEPFETDSEQPQTPAEQEASEAAVEEIPDWLKQLAGELPAEEASQIPVQEAQPAETIQPSPSEPATEVTTPREVEAESETQIPEVTSAIAEAGMAETVPPTEVPETPKEPIAEEATLLAEQAPADQKAALPERLLEAEMPLEGVELPAMEIPEITQQPPAILEEEVAAVSGEIPELEVPTPIEQPPAVNLQGAVQGEAPQEMTAVSEEPTPAQEPSQAEELAETGPSVGEVTPPPEQPVATEQLPTEETLSMAEELPSAEKAVGAEPVPNHELPGVEPETAQPFEAEQESDAFAWLKELAAEQGPTEENLPATTEGGEILPPEWVKLEAEPPSEEIIEPESKAPEVKAVPADEIPDWIKGLGEEKEAEPATERPAAPVPEIELSENENEELPAWLRELEEPEVEKSESSPQPEGQEWKPDELPTWLKEITESEPPSVAPTPEFTPTVEQVASAEAQPISPEAAATEEETSAEVLPVSLEAPSAEEVTSVEVTPPIEEAPTTEEVTPVEVPPTIAEAPAGEEVVPAEVSQASKEAPAEEEIIPAEVPPAAAQVPASEELIQSEVPPAFAEAPAVEELAPAEGMPVVADIPVIGEAVPHEVTPATAEETAAEEAPLVVPPAGEAPLPAEVPPSNIPPASAWYEEVTPPAGIKKEALEEAPAEAEQPVPAVPAQAPVPFKEEAAATPVEEAELPEDALKSFQAVSQANQNTLSDARNAVSSGSATQAIKFYNKLIEQNYHLDEIIKDLQDALYRFPVDIDVWVTLGDAHFRVGDLTAALSAYTKAEELVR